MEEGSGSASHTVQSCKVSLVVALLVGSEQACLLLAERWGDALHALLGLSY